MNLLSTLASDGPWFWLACGSWNLLCWCLPAHFERKLRDASKRYRDEARLLNHEFGVAQHRFAEELRGLGVPADHVERLHRMADHLAPRSVQ